MRITFKLFIFFLTSLSTSKSFSQHSNSASKVIFGEICGAGGVISANYDMRFKKTNTGLGFRAGFGALPTDADLVYFFPVGLNYLLGKNKHYFEAGVGHTFMVGIKDFQLPSSKTTALHYNFLELGYRYQPIDKHFMYRIMWSPVFNNDFIEPLWFGVSLGYKF